MASDCGRPSHHRVVDRCRRHTRLLGRQVAPGVPSDRHAQWSSRSPWCWSVHASIDSGTAHCDTRASQRSPRGRGPRHLPQGPSPRPGAAAGAVFDLLVIRLPSTHWCGRGILDSDRRRHNWRESCATPGRPGTGQRCPSRTGQERVSTAVRVEIRKARSGAYGHPDLRIGGFEADQPLRSPGPNGTSTACLRSASRGTIRSAFS